MRRNVDDDGGSIYGMPYHIYEGVFLERHLAGSLTELETWRIRTLLTNMDRVAAKKALNDMGKLVGKLPPEPKKVKTCEIAKFVPGTHHYVLGKKFDTLEQAIAHANEKGYAVSRVFEVDGSGANAVALRRVFEKTEDDE